jgi:hypothetical protein
MSAPTTTGRESQASRSTCAATSVASGSKALTSIAGHQPSVATRSARCHSASTTSPGAPRSRSRLSRATANASVERTTTATSHPSASAPGSSRRTNSASGKPSASAVAVRVA